MGNNPLALQRISYLPRGHCFQMSIPIKETAVFKLTGFSSWKELIFMKIKNVYKWCAVFDYISYW